jgi:hypothetical protein
VKSALVVGFEVTIAFKASPAKSHQLTFVPTSRDKCTIFYTGSTHQICCSCQVGFKFPFTRYTPSVLFGQSLDNLILVTLPRQPSFTGLHSRQLTFSAASLSFSANFCFKVIFFFNGAAPTTGAKEGFLGFSESDTSQSSFFVSPFDPNVAAAKPGLD